MLLVATRIGPSSIHGLGLFTVAALPKGTLIWRFTPGFDLVLDPALLQALPAAQRDNLLHYGYIDARLQRYILCCDDARFINHSPDPNLCSDYRRDPFGEDTATRDIAAGEELTVDYGPLEITPDEIHP